MQLDTAANLIKSHADDGMHRHGAFDTLADAARELVTRASHAHVAATKSPEGTPDTDALRRLAQTGGIALRALQQFALEDDPNIGRVKSTPAPTPD